LLRKYNSKQSQKIPSIQKYEYPSQKPPLLLSHPPHQRKVITNTPSHSKRRILADLIRIKVTFLSKQMVPNPKKTASKPNIPKSPITKNTNASPENVFTIPENTITIPENQK
tara:strand:- start:36455 stop:36790 length:336 start_codon:yes stop_codon:yes gene_type:complete